MMFSFHLFLKRDAKKLAKKYPSLTEDIEQLISSLERNPYQGKDLGFNCYKIRLKISSKNKGKSGGARVITYLINKNLQVVLIAIYDKSEISKLSNEEIKERIKRIQ